MAITVILSLASMGGKQPHATVHDYWKRMVSIRFLICSPARTNLGTGLSWFGLDVRTGPHGLSVDLLEVFRKY